MERNLAELNYQVIDTIRTDPRADAELAQVLRCPPACIRAVRRLSHGSQELVLPSLVAGSSLLQIELRGEPDDSAWTLSETLAMEHLALLKQAANEGNIILMSLKFNCAADLVERIAQMSEQQMRDALQAGQLQLHFNEAAAQHLGDMASPAYQRTCRMTEMLTHQVDDPALYY